jgi:hypothetical protein
MRTMLQIMRIERCLQCALIKKFSLGLLKIHRLSRIVKLSSSEPGVFIVEMPSRAKAYDMLLQPEDNKILLVGRRGLSAPYNYAAARMLANGTLDTGFATSGRFSYDFGGSDIARGVIRRYNSAQNKFEILISGQSETVLGFGFAILALEDNGQIDTSVASHGTRIFMFDAPTASFTPVAEATMGGPMLLKGANNGVLIGGASTNSFHLLTVDN